MTSVALPAEARKGQDDFANEEDGGDGRIFGITKEGGAIAFPRLGGLSWEDDVPAANETHPILGHGSGGRPGWRTPALGRRRPLATRAPGLSLQETFDLARDRIVRVQVSVEEPLDVAHLPAARGLVVERSSKNRRSPTMASSRSSTCLDQLAISKSPPRSPERCARSGTAGERYRQRVNGQERRPTDPRPFGSALTVS